MKTVADILDAVLRSYYGEDDLESHPEFLLNSPPIGIKFERFTSILCDPIKPMYSSRRTIREKWKLLHDLGYFTEVNQRASRINIGKVYEDYYKLE